MLEDAKPGQEPRAPRRREVNSGQFAPGEMERGKIRGSSKERTLLRCHAEPGQAHGLSPCMLLVWHLLTGTHAMGQSLQGEVGRGCHRGQVRSV